MDIPYGFSNWILFAPQTRHCPNLLSLHITHFICEYYAASQVNQNLRLSCLFLHTLCPQTPPANFPSWICHCLYILLFYIIHSSLLLVPSTPFNPYPTMLTRDLSRTLMGSSDLLKEHSKESPVPNQEELAKS